jgi:hypothetical protein
LSAAIHRRFFCVWSSKNKFSSVGKSSDESSHSKINAERQKNILGGIASVIVASIAAIRYLVADSHPLDAHHSLQFHDLQSFAV